MTSTPAGAVSEFDSGAVSSYLYWGVGLLLLIPVWAAGFFPTEDGPAHMYWVEVYRALGDPEHAFHRYFVRDLHPLTPFHLVEFGVQYGLAAVLPPVLAQKVHVSLIVLFWIGALHFLAVSVRFRVTLGALAGLLLIHSAWLYGGFFAFMGAMPLVLLTLGLLARLVSRGGDRSGWPLYVAIALLGIAAYIAHLFVAALFVLLCGFWWILVTPNLRYRRGPLLFAALPTVLLILWYLTAGTVGGGGTRWEPVLRATARFVGFAFFRGFASPQPSFWIALSILAAVLAALCWTALGAMKRGELGPAGRFAVLLAAITACLFLLAPEKVGEAGNFNGRIQFALWAWLLPTLPYGLSPKWRALLTAAIAGLLLWQVVTFSLRARRFSAHYDDALARIETLPPGSTLQGRFPYERSRYEGSFIRVLAHLPEDIARRQEAALPISFFPALDFYWVKLRPGVAVQPDRWVDLKQGGSGQFSFVLLSAEDP